MDVVVVYETHFGQTRAVALEVAEGARSAGAAVSVVTVDAASPDLVAGADLLVVGAPTHAEGMSRPRTRGWARPQTVGTHGDVGDGVREWLHGVPASGAGQRAAAFDTRLPFAMAGGAARGVARALRAHGFALAAEPEGFVVVDIDGPLQKGELARARSWGAALVRAAAAPATP